MMDDPNAGNIKYVSMIPVEVMDDKNASMVPVNTVAVEWVVCLLETSPSVLRIF